MPHISKAVEYATHCLLYLVDSDDRHPQRPLKDLAEMQGVPAPYLAKIFTRLSKVGLVTSSEGVRGGFQLGRPPAQISVLDIVRAVDGDIPLFDCLNIRTRCALFRSQAPDWASSGLCEIHAVMRDAEQKMQDSLASHTLASLNRNLSRKAPDSYSEDVIRWFGERQQQRRPNSPSNPRNKHENSPR